jgi:small subunit ribosomal protein S4
MARYTGPVCKLCRREGQKLFLKGTKCFTDKCPIERRPYAPGQHGQGAGGGRRRKTSEYAHQLREKQKVKRIYGVAERPFRNLFEKAAHLPGVTGENLLVGLESRLDNIMYRMGFASSRKEARQLINHGHVQVNGRKVDIASAQVQPGDEVRIAPRARTSCPCRSRSSPRRAPRRSAGWRWTRARGPGRMVSRPTRADIPLAVQEQLIVELYSK